MESYLWPIAKFPQDFLRKKRFAGITKNSEKIKQKQKDPKNVKNSMIQKSKNQTTRNPKNSKTK